jgi:hypothetical protein
MSLLAIDQAFISKFIDEDFELPIVYENSNYSPVPGTPFVELICLNNGVTEYSLSSSLETEGIFRIFLRYPPDKYSIEAKQKAEEIFSAFPIGFVVKYENIRSKIVGHKRQTGTFGKEPTTTFPEEGWYKLVVSIMHKTFITRS